MSLVNIVTVEMPFQMRQVEMPQSLPLRPYTRVMEWRDWFKELDPDASITTVDGHEIRVRHIIRAWVEENRPS